MGIGTSMKETSLHYYRDPLVEMVSEDQDVNLRGIIIVGSPDKNEDKLLSSERVGVTLECARADGAIFSCNGLGNNHIDYAHAIEAAEKRGVPVVALSMVPAKDFVVQNDCLDGVLCYYKAFEKNGSHGGRDHCAGRKYSERTGRKKGAGDAETEDEKKGEQLRLFPLCGCPSEYFWGNDFVDWFP